MNTRRVPKQILCNHPRRQINQCPMKRWEENTRL